VMRPDRPRAVADWLPAAGIALVAVVARLAALGREGVWCDEGYTAGIVRRAPLGILHALERADDAPPLFYLLTHWTTAVFGRSEFALRLLPAFAGIAAVVWLLARARRRGEPAYVWTAGFFAVAGYAVFYARQARAYGLLLLLALAVVLAARDLLTRPARRPGVTLAVAGSLLVLTHNLGILLIGTSVLLWPLRARPGIPLRRWLLWHAAPVCVWAIYAVASLAQFRAHAELNTWMGRFWGAHPLALAPLFSLAAYVPGALPRLGLAVPLPALPGDSIALHVVSGAAAAACLVVAFRRPKGIGGSSGREARIDAAFCLIPLAGMALASAVWTPSYVLGRTDAIAFAPFALWLGRGLARLPRGAAAAALAFWALVSLGSVAPGYGIGSPGRAKGADREVARAMVRGGLHTGDWVVHSYLTAPSIEYYLERAGAAHQVAFYPPDAGWNPAGVRATPADSLDAYVSEARALRRRLEGEMPAGACVWVLALTERAPARAATELTAADLAYPPSLLVSLLVGSEPLAPQLRYRQDWVGGDRVLLRLARADWVAPETLGPVRLEPGPAP
jgi:hypothetical protein